MDRESILGHVDAALEKFGRPKTIKLNWFSGRAPLPKEIAGFVDRKVNNSIRNAVKGANDQLLSTKRFIPDGSNYILFVANLGETLFGPIELLEVIASQVLERSQLVVGAIMLTTPGVTYAGPESVHKHYAGQVYADGKIHLADFV